MRKVILVFILLIGTVKAEANIFGSVIGGIGSIFGFSRSDKVTHIDFSKKSTELENVKAELSTLSKNQIEMKELIKAEIKLEIKAEMEVKMNNKIAAYDNSQKAGRDVIQIKKNDAWMIMYIVSGIFGFAGAVVTGLITTIGLLIRKIFKMIQNSAETELKQTKLWLKNMTKSKEEYKKIVQKNGFTTKGGGVE